MLPGKVDGGVPARAGYDGEEPATARGGRSNPSISFAGREEESRVGIFSDPLPGLAPGSVTKEEGS